MASERNDAENLAVDIARQIEVSKDLDGNILEGELMQNLLTFIINRDGKVLKHGIDIAGDIRDVRAS